MIDGRAMPIFNAIYDVYDNVKLLRKPAERLAVNAGLTTGQQVLDVACGTGWATIAAANLVGDSGKVVGIDIADKLLDVARSKTYSAGLSNVEYRVGDAEALEFDDASFDAVICASSIFFLRDIPKALHEWHRILKVNGIIAFSSFGPGQGQPMLGLFQERLARYEGQTSTSLQRIDKTDTPEECHLLLKHSGFKDIIITTEQLGFFLPDTLAYWEEISSNIFKLRLSRLNPVDLERFRSEHIAEVESLRTDQGIWLDIPTHFSVARKL
jgi:ubiquinone/menaquinone biosynthesis C-methylase UbiE